MTQPKVSIENGMYNRYEILDKVDVLHKLRGVSNKVSYTDKDLYTQICNEINVTAKSTARLFLFDNKHYKVCSLSISLYDKLYTLLDAYLPMNITVSYNVDLKGDK